MLRNTALAAALILCAPSVASAGAMDLALAKLDPVERSHQACIIKGLQAVRSDQQLRKADRMKTSILSRAVLNGTTLTAKGGAVRVAGRWYALSFTCDLTSDLMNAKTFKFALGQEIAKENWERYGLWN
jgi:hypothetical protein